jgi:cytochrome c oxidase cbb3-type subunit 2
MDLLGKHGVIERNASLLLVLSLVVVCIGGIVEVAPLFYFQNTIEKVDGMRPYTPLELAGRDIYIREGCYVCHSQMIRPFRDEVERYGNYSLAAESMYDHPFQWGSTRTGPDLARVGGRYSSAWNVEHLISPRAVVPESVMPSYAFLAQADLDFGEIDKHLRANAIVGVPYSEEMIANAEADLRAQLNPDADRAACPLSQDQGRGLRRRLAPDHRDGCARRLPPDARDAGRFHDLRRQSQLSLRPS